MLQPAVAHEICWILYREDVDVDVTPLPLCVEERSGDKSRMTPDYAQQAPLVTHGCCQVITANIHGVDV
jgi:hypothetical protein